MARLPVVISDAISAKPPRISNTGQAHCQSNTSRSSTNNTHAARPVKARPNTNEIGSKLCRCMACSSLTLDPNDAHADFQLEHQIHIPVTVGHGQLVVDSETTALLAEDVEGAQADVGVDGDIELIR